MEMKKKPSTSHSIQMDVQIAESLNGDNEWISQ